MEEELINCPNCNAEVYEADISSCPSCVSEMCDGCEDVFGCTECGNPICEMCVCDLNGEEYCQNCADVIQGND